MPLASLIAALLSALLFAKFAKAQEAFLIALLSWPPCSSNTSGSTPPACLQHAQPALLQILGCSAMTVQLHIQIQQSCSLAACHAAELAC